MICIGKSYIVHVGGMSRLCSDITVVRPGEVIQKVKRTLWFAIDIVHEDCLCVGRSDAFVFLLLAYAMRYRHDIVCEDEMSERLHYSCSSLILTLSATGMPYNKISIKAPLTSVPYPNSNAVGTGFSGGIDCLYTIMNHLNDEYPLTHIAVFNSVAFQKYGPEVYRDIFGKTCVKAQAFAREFNLDTVFCDTNFYEVLNEEFTNEIFTFRIIACVLALQGLFSMYLVSSDRAAREFELLFDNCASFDLLTVGHSSTESLRFYLTGTEVTRSERLIALSDWKPSRKWLHPCYNHNIVGERNCGCCKKCKEAETILYALGKLDEYASVFDVEEYKENFPKYLAYIMANSNDSRAREVLNVIRDMNVSVPAESYVYEKIFRRACTVFSENTNKKGGSK